MEFEKQNIIVTDWETEKVTRVQRIKEQKQRLKNLLTHENCRFATPQKVEQLTYLFELRKEPESHLKDKQLVNVKREFT